MGTRRGLNAKKLCGMRQGVCGKPSNSMPEMLSRVKEYLRDHTRAPLASVSEETETPVKTIEEFIREGRLVVVAGSAFGTCSICGKGIRQGRICRTCASGLARPRSDGPPIDAGTREQARFHTRDGKKRR